MGFVYLVQCNEFYKIGVATNMLQRLAGLQTGNPYPLRVIAYYRIENPVEVEARLHFRFQKKSHGGEWFKFDEQDVKRVCEDLEQMGGEKMPYLIGLPRFPVKR